MTHKINPKELGFNKKSITTKAGSYINKKGELIKTREYVSMHDPEEMTKMEELNLYNDRFDKDGKRKKRKAKPKTKRCKCK